MTKLPTDEEMMNELMQRFRTDIYEQCLNYAKEVEQENALLNKKLEIAVQALNDIQESGRYTGEGSMAKLALIKITTIQKEAGE